MPDFMPDLDFFLKPMKLERYVLKNKSVQRALYFEKDFELTGGGKLLIIPPQGFLVLLSNERLQPREAMREMLRNIFKYLQISLDFCTFAWVCPSGPTVQSARFSESAESFEFSELCEITEPQKILSFGVNIEAELLVLKTLDLSHVLLQPILKRQVFEDVNRLLFSSARPA